MSKANGEMPSDAYAGIHKQRLERALKDARDLIDVKVLTIATMPISELLEMADSDSTKSYDEIVKAICEDRAKKLRDPYACYDTTYHAFRDEVGEQASLALYDCERLLAEEAYTGELASYRKAVTSEFRPRCWDTYESNYIEAINTIADIARKNAKDDKHYAEVVESTILAYQKALSESKYAKALTARRYILFEQLPIYADIREIGWALNDDWISLESDIPIASPDCRKDLINLGFRTMKDLTDPSVTKKLEPHASLREKVNQTVDYVSSCA
jgi:hypothetical protein